MFRMFLSFAISDADTATSFDNKDLFFKYANLILAIFFFYKIIIKFLFVI